jgi:hypothetical protein
MIRTPTPAPPRAWTSGSGAAAPGLISIPKRARLLAALDDEVAAAILQRIASSSSLPKQCWPSARQVCDSFKRRAGRPLTGDAASQTRRAPSVSAEPANWPASNREGFAAETVENGKFARVPFEDLPVGVTVFGVWVKVSQVRKYLKCRRKARSGFG